MMEDEYERDGRLGRRMLVARLLWLRRMGAVSAMGIGAGEPGCDGFDHPGGEGDAEGSGKEEVSDADVYRPFDHVGVFQTQAEAHR